ncbi:MAG: class I SAM-dependent methyltransferase [Candidatus Woesearchaeota archaeon]|jgi:putative AdoMet-dependent methyltransferase
MKSKYSQKYNHDPIATKYDKNVKNETNPVRAGYQDLLNWVKLNTHNSKIIVDLGCGTGNTIQKINNFEKAYCIDISSNMLSIAKKKLKNKKNIIFIKSDLLEFFSNHKNLKANTIISTYAIHHLTQEEKHKLFKKIFGFLNKDGIVIFGDLMFKNKRQENILRKKYPKLKKDFDDEFYWHVDDEVKELKSLSFEVEIKQFSDLSWGIYAKK